MCGISVIISCCTCSDNNCCKIPNAQHILLLKNRGPDAFHNYKTKIMDKIDLIVNASVLHQRGPLSAAQPLISENGAVLLWNGEIFNDEVVGLESGKNDTEFVLNELNHCQDTVPLNFLTKINGPYAFVFIDGEVKNLWFGKDIFGRRSLLWKKHAKEKCSFLWISSVGDGTDDWEEIPANGIYCLNFKKFPSLVCFPWSQPISGIENYIGVSSEAVAQYRLKSECIQTPILRTLNSVVLRDRVANESVFQYICNLYNFHQSDEPLSLKKLEETAMQSDLTKIIPEILEELCASNPFRETVENFICLFSESVKKRIKNHPFVCKNCFVQNISACSHTSLAVLFSGGIDSMMLAYMANQHLPEGAVIDLLNVSFEHTIRAHIGSGKSKSYTSPDRKTGISGYDELKRVCPRRKWNFVEINVTAEDLTHCREERIKYLIKPCTTVLDDSIGCATWFAARGEGLVAREDEKLSGRYSSPARVVLLGMGADEQLGGYSRHRNKYSSGGWKALVAEIGLEIDRISDRNLGRDDRIVSDSGREARFPFLDENLVGFLNSLPIHLKANLEFPRGLGEKILLRLAAFHLGLRSAAILPKRAIQFGSRIAFTEIREKGSNVCSRLK